MEISIQEFCLAYVGLLFSSVLKPKTQNSEDLKTITWKNAEQLQNFPHIRFTESEPFEERGV